MSRTRSMLVVGFRTFLVVVAIQSCLLGAGYEASSETEANDALSTGVMGNWDWGWNPPRYNLGPYNGERLFVKSESSESSPAVAPLVNEYWNDPKINFRLENYFTSKSILVVFMGPTAVQINCTDPAVQAQKLGNLGKGQLTEVIGALGEDWVTQTVTDLTGSFVAFPASFAPGSVVGTVAITAAAAGAGVLVDNVNGGYEFDIVAFKINIPLAKTYEFNVSRPSCWQDPVHCQGPLNMTYAVVPFDGSTEQSAVNMLYHQYRSYTSSGNTDIWDRDFDPRVLANITEATGLGVGKTGQLNLHYRGPSGIDLLVAVSGPGGAIGSDFSIAPLNNAYQAQALYPGGDLESTLADLESKVDISGWCFDVFSGTLEEQSFYNAIPIPVDWKSSSLASWGVNVLARPNAWQRWNANWASIARDTKRKLTQFDDVRQFKKLGKNFIGAAISASLNVLFEQGAVRVVKIPNAQQGTTYSFRIDNPTTHPYSSNTISITSFTTSSRAFDPVPSSNFQLIQRGQSAIYTFGVRNTGNIDDILQLTMRFPNDAEGWTCELHRIGYGKVADIANPQVTYAFENGEQRLFELRVSSSAESQALDFPVELEVLSPLAYEYITSTFTTRLNISQQIVEITTDHPNGDYQVGQTATFDINVRDQNNSLIDPTSFSAAFNAIDVTSQITHPSIGHYQWHSMTLSEGTPAFVFGCNSLGYHPGAASRSLSVGAAPPQTPIWRQISAGDGYIDLTWYSNPEPNIEEYKVWRATSSGGPYNVIATVSHPTVTYHDAPLVNGSYYYYKLTAVNTSDIQSDLSDYNVGVPRASTLLNVTARCMQSQNGWPNDTVNVMAFDLSTSSNPLTVTVIRVQLTGSATYPNDIAYASLYEDLNANCVWDAGDLLLDSKDMGVNNRFPFFTHLTIGQTKRHFLVAYRIAQAATTLIDYGGCLDQNSFEAGPYVTVNLSQTPFCSSLGTIDNPDNCGPNVFNLMPEPAGIFAPATLVRFRCNVIDGLCNELPGNCITLVELFMDQTGANGSGIAMTDYQSGENCKDRFVETMVANPGWADGVHTAYVHARDARGNWGPFQSVSFLVAYGKLSTQIGHETANFDLSRGSDGKLHVIYNQGFGVIVYSYSTDDGATWSTPELVSQSGYTAFEPSGQIGSDNIFRAVYVVNTPLSDRGVWFAKREAGVWSREKIYSTTVFVFFHPLLALDNSNQSHVVYKGWVLADGYTHLFYEKGSFSSWSSTEDVNGGRPASLDEYAIEVDNSNVPHVVFSDNSDSRMYYANRSSGSWSREDLGSTANTIPRLLFHAGTLGLIYKSNSDYEVKFRKRTSGVWSAAANISESPSIASTTPELTYDASGKLYAVWADSKPGNFDIFFRTSTDQGTTWAPCNINLSNTPLRSFIPRATHRSFGNEVVTLWLEGDASPYLIKSQKAVISQTVPSAAISSPVNGSSVGGNCIVSGTVGGVNFMNAVLLHGSGSSPVSWDTLAGYSIPITGGVLSSWNTGNVANGSHTLLLITNGTNCLSDSDRVVVTVDNGAPIASPVNQLNPYFSPNADLVKDSTTVEFILSKPCVVTAKVTNSYNGLVRLIANGLSFGAGAVQLVWDGRDNGGALVVDGPYTFRVEYTDLIGTAGPPVLVPVVKDNDAPIVSIIDTTQIRGTIWDANLSAAYLFRDTSSTVASDSIDYVVVSSIIWVPIATDAYRITTLDRAGNEGSYTFILPQVDCGDFDSSRRIDMTDVVYLVNYIFAGGSAPLDPSGGDINCSNRTDIGDAVYMVNYIFAGGPAPCSSSGCTSGGMMSERRARHSAILRTMFEEGPGNSSLRLQVSAAVEVSGVELLFSASGKSSPIEINCLVSGMEVFSGWAQDGTFRVGLIDLSGQVSIEEGTIDVLRMAYDADAEFNVVSVFMYDRSADEMLVRIERLNGEMALPKAFELHQNWPNPFNPATNINYELPEAAHVQVDVYNILGQHVRQLENVDRNPGRYSIRWDSLDDTGRPVASGVYLYRLRAGEFVTTRKMILMK